MTGLKKSTSSNLRQEACVCFTRSCLIFICILFVSYVSARFQTVEIPEGLSSGKVILQLPKMPGVKYILHTDSTTDYFHNLFRVTPDGILSLEAALDFEDQRGNEFDVVVIRRKIEEKDGGEALVIHVKVLDRNDNAPRFTNDLFTAFVRENTQIGSYLTGLENVFAKDLDSGVNSLQSYKIIAGNIDGKFGIELNDIEGVKVLRIKTTGKIDREKNSFYVLTVEATDGGNPSLSSTAQIRVNILDENDCGPEFDGAIYSVNINENTPPGTSIFQLKAVDKDVGKNADIYYRFQRDHDFFAINPHTGVIEVAKALNFEQGSSHDLSVLAVDRGINMRQTSKHVQVRITDIRGYPPPVLRETRDCTRLDFETDSYYVKIRNDFPVGGDVIRVYATCRGKYAGVFDTVALEYSLKIRDKWRNVFRINRNNGVISLIKRLNNNNKLSYKLKVKARHVDKPEKEIYIAQTNVIIDIESVDDNYFDPVFNISTMVVPVSENTAPGRSVMAVSAFDNDNGLNGRVQYFFTGGSGLGKFSIMKNSGVIKILANPANFIEDSFDLYISATDRGKFPRQANMYLIVEIVGENRKRPLFLPVSRVVHISENLPGNSFVTVIKAVNRNRLKAPLEYQITAGNSDGNFVMDSSSGVIHTRRALDREDIDRYILDIQAKVKGAEKMVSLAQVVVIVTDVNDNAPLFGRREYHVSLLENQAFVKNLLCLAASDRDTGENGNITYTIESGNESGLFSIDGNLGIISSLSLDYEQQPVHSLTVRATDHGIPSRSATTTVKVIVRDSNDAPRFSKKLYEVVLKESARHGIVAIFTAFDEDGIDDVNVPEKSELRTVLTELKVTDADRGSNGKFSCTMEDADVEEVMGFLVSTKQSGCALILLEYLDYSRRNVYNFKVRVTDQAIQTNRKSSVAAVIIRVRDENNNRPVFDHSSYWTTAEETVPKGTTITRVTADDSDDGLNAAVTYSLTSPYFTISSKDGIVSAKMQLIKKSTKYEAVVRATDQGTPRMTSEARIYVSVHSVHDFPPRFQNSSYHVKVVEDLSKGSTLVTVAVADSSSADIKSVLFSLVGGNINEQFIIDATTGAVTLSKKLDYEEVKLYKLIVRAVQTHVNPNVPDLSSEVPLFVEVTNVNDNHPRFATAKDPFEVILNKRADKQAEERLYVTKVTAYDKDLDDIIYELEPGNNDFNVDRNTGVITTKRNMNKQSYTFAVTASDGKLKGAANIRVIVNAAPEVPSFSGYVYRKSIPETTLAGTQVMEFEPRNSVDSALQYSIDSGNFGNVFCIDVTGRLRTILPLDRERVAKYELNVNVNMRSGENSSLRIVVPDVSVSILDVNDNAPVFLQSYKMYARENVIKARYAIGDLTAYDPDGGENGKLTYTIVNTEDIGSDNMFVIEGASLVNTGHSVIDREMMPQHTLTIRASDGGRPSLSCLTQVIIIVQDENDHDPQFTAPSYRVSIPSNVPVGYSILQLLATDLDRGLNAMIRLDVAVSHPPGMFSIDSENGSLKLEKRPTNIQPIRAKIIARDLGMPSRNTSVRVTVAIRATTGPPQFLVTPMVGHVLENQQPGVTVVTVAAASVDPVTYKILSGNDAGLFRIHPGTGQIETTWKLDREKTSSYEFTVVAADIKGRISEGRVKINVDNKNDNKPEILNSVNGIVEGHIPINAAVGSRIMNFLVQDKDGDTLSFIIRENAARSYFAIDSSGIVRSKLPLNDLKNPFIFTVNVSDNGDPLLTTTTTARLVLLKYHMNQREEVVSVREDLLLGKSVTTINPGSGLNNAIFSIISPVECPFKIDRRSGVIRLKQELDYESKTSHTIIAQVTNQRNPENYHNVFVVVKVKDANDNSPVFAMEPVSGQFVAMVNSHTRERTSIYTLFARDADSGLNGAVRFRIVFGAKGRFEIDKETGKDIIIKGSTYLPLPWYNLTVRATDKGYPPRSSEVVVNVKVGDFPPRFNSSEYVFTVKENAQRGHIVGVLGARSYSGAALKFEIIQGNGQRKFLLDSITGRLTLPDPLDYELDPNIYFLRVRASEVATIKPFSSEVSVKVVLLDVNDNSPEFLQLSYIDNLPESAPIGTKILSVSAVDKDSGIKGQFRFWLDNPYFAIDPYLGILTTRKELDYEGKPAHTFQVFAQDGGENPLNGSALIEIKLTNINDNAPRFTQSIYSVFVVEDAGPSEMVATVQASDEDGDPVTYSITYGDRTGSFVIDRDKGVIKLIDKTNTNLIGPTYTLNISASDGYHVSEAIVVVGVQDVNNYSPVFTECDGYKPTVAEHSALGTTVFKVTAEDQDMGTNGRIEYQLKRETGAAKVFEIDNRTGVVTTAFDFDREVKQMYQLVITGVDGGSNSERREGICQVDIQILDINDHSPLFDMSSGYTLSVPENVPIGKSVLQASANDEDLGTNALISYSLKEKNQFFTIENSTGIIRTKAELKNHAKWSRFTVVARDHGQPSRSSENIVNVAVFDVTKDPPRFSRSIYEEYVKENIPIGSRIITIKAKTNRPGFIFHSIDGYLPHTGKSSFRIDSLSGEVTVQRALDYETTSNFTLKISAKIYGSNPLLISYTTLKIYLEDINDSPPDFTQRGQYKGQVKENSPIGTTVLRVKAVDKDSSDNGRVSYHLKSDHLYFTLNTNSGVITTKQVFDRETRGLYYFVVEARDHGSPAMTDACVVEINIGDENDNAPAFEKGSYNISVYEDELVRRELMKVVATDRDIGVNARVRYHITDGNTGAVFAIDGNSGKISVASILDRETKDFYRLSISALDGKHSGNTVVYIRVLDVNDNNPTFGRSVYEGHVVENAASNTTVMTLTANDVDQGVGGKFTFSISGQGLAAFKVDPVTGVISTKKSLDRETKSRYEFLAFATDGPGEKNKARRTGSCDVIINIRDVNDNAPEFPNEPYIGNVQENLPPGASVMELSAVDKDDPAENGNAVIRYELISDAAGLFAIDSKSGLITTTAELDRESVNDYSVVVKATDNGKTPLTGKVSVRIQVTDANDQKPKFTQRIFHANVSESVPIGTPVLVLRAFDKDTGTNAKLRYKIIHWRKHNMFRLVEDTGVLKVAYRLDYEGKKRFHFKVEAKDQGIPPYSDVAKVVINVQDYNDNPPVFEPLSYGETVSENVTVGTSLLRVNASDSDTGLNKEFFFSIADGDRASQFRVDPITGDLFVAKPLDREETAVHVLTIRATNIGLPKMYGEATVRIHLTDINDNGPRFNPPVYRIYVTENVSAPVAIGKLTVDDPDEPSNGAPFVFGIVGDSANRMFSVHNRTGVLETKVEFDREEQAVYSFQVWARDSGNPPQTSVTTVHAHIKDVNDNPHSAGSLKLTLNTLQHKFGGGPVGKVYVVDKDTDDERLYTLQEASSEYFDVNLYSGVIESQPNVPAGVYNLKVKVADRDPKSKNKAVISTVRIAVVQIPTEAVEKSIAIRLRGISRESFLIILPLFKEALADFLGTKPENVKLFSLQETDTGRSVIDVRFAAHGSPYYSPERMLAVLRPQRPKLEEVWSQVETIGVDECAKEPCETGFCRNHLSYDGTVESIKFKGRSFASLKTSLTAVCESCKQEDKSFQKCKPEFCLNGGTCRDAPTGHVCDCPVGLHGNNCELTTRSFKPGEWAWFPSLRQCRDSLLSLEFATKESSGLLLYSGPTSAFDDLRDFIAVALINGDISVLMSIGDVADIVELQLSNAGELTDGEWHLVEVRLNFTEVIVTVDKCRLSSVVEKESGERTEDRSRCEATARFKRNTFKVLNPSGPVQLGGISNRDLMYPQKLKIKDFNGCIRNVINDGKLYDLKNPSLQKGSNEGCPVMYKHCLPQSSCHGNAKCVPSWTGYSCHCPVGFRGDKCREEIQPHTFDEGSYTQYQFTNMFRYSPRETRIEMRVRTRDTNGGILMHASGTFQSEQNILEIQSLRKESEGGVNLVYSYNLGDVNHAVTLSGVNITDGKWHHVIVTRYGTKAELKVDVDGFWFSTKGDSGGAHTQFSFHPSKTYIGGLPKSMKSRRRRDVINDFVGCIQDFRLNGYPLYLTRSTDIAIATSTGVQEGCSSTACVTAQCSDTMWCHDQWKVYTCLPRLCTTRSCLNGGTCFEGVDSRGMNMFHCKCTSEFQGLLCNVGRAVISPRPGTGRWSGGLAIGLSILMVILMLAVCFVVVCFKKKKQLKRGELNLEENLFRRDNIIDYCIEGGGEEDMTDGIGICKDILADVDGSSLRTSDKKFAAQGKRHLFKGHAYPITEPDSGANYIEVPFYRNGLLGKPRMKSSVNINPVKQRRDKRLPCTILSYSSKDERPKTPSGHFEEQYCKSDRSERKKRLETVKEECEDRIPKGPVLVVFGKSGNMDYGSKSPLGSKKSPINSTLESLTSIGDSEGCATPSPSNWVRAEVMSTGESGCSENELSSSILGKNAPCTDRLAPLFSNSQGGSELFSPDSMDSGHLTLSSPDSPDSTCYFSADEGLMPKVSVPSQDAVRNKMNEESDDESEGFPPPPLPLDFSEGERVPDEIGLDTICKPISAHLPDGKICHEKNVNSPDGDTGCKPRKEPHLMTTVPEEIVLHGENNKSSKNVRSSRNPIQYCNPTYASMNLNHFNEDFPSTRGTRDIANLPPESMPQANFKLNPLYGVHAADKFLPPDAVEHYHYEGGGSPSASLSSVESSSSDGAGIDPEKISQLGDKFKKLAKIYGVKHVSFSPKDEIIKEYK